MENYEFYYWTYSGQEFYISEKCIINGRTETDPNLIADGFGKYFSGIGKQFAEAIPQPNDSPEYCMRENQNVHTMFMNPTDPGEIAKIIGSCKSKKSTGDDGISMMLLKQTYQRCSLPISIIVNMYKSKKAKSKESLGNYRPISLLPNISKILEKAVHKRLYSFLCRHDILYNSQ